MAASSFGAKARRRAGARHAYSIQRSTPCANHKLFLKLDFAKSDDERERMRTRGYLQLLGKLAYMTTMTRPDLALYTSVLARFMCDPSEQCMAAAEHLLFYAASTAKRSIAYSSDIHVPKMFHDVSLHIKQNAGCMAMCDSSWGVENPSYGYVIYLANGPVSWASKKLKSATSSAEGEYEASFECNRELTFIRNLSAEMGCVLRGKLIIGVDNDAAIKISKNEGVTQRNKHFKLVTHKVREDVLHGAVELFKIHTDLNTSDIFTKPLDPWKFKLFRDQLVTITTTRTRAASAGVK